MKNDESLFSDNPETNRLIARNFYHTIPRPRVASRANEQVLKLSLFHFGPRTSLPTVFVSQSSSRQQVRGHNKSHPHRAFPRASPFITVTASSPDNESKEERGARVQLCASEFLSLQAQHRPDNSSAQPRVLWGAVDRYIRKGNGGGLALLLHANGLHKVNIYLYLIRGGFAVPHTELF
jgi:hypothetical protein